MEYILQTENLSKVYGAKTVLNHVSIHVPKGSIYGLVGKNGAGKTTLMRIICGLTQQSEGSSTLLGKTDDETVRRNMGMLIEKPGIYEHMTALENLRYFSLLFGIGDREHQRILEMVGLQNAGKKKASQFSLGMKQRLGIAIALLGNPDFLILDEPINGLDPEGVYEMRKMLEMLNREHGTTIMIASHILSELHKLATDYAIIDGGCLIDEFSKDTLESACSSSVQIMVEPEYLQDAKMLIASRYPDVRCEILSNQKLRLYEKIDPADLNQFLVEHKVRVCGLGANDEDVERFFVEKLSGGKAV
ncbi:MAG: ABC transporter ATP-binding protein [Dysosmobacter sp.]|uniref:ABC transporter ATP-binding protein n=1 Tax=Dysosmobacter sp. TaxID=2591382 RepID=UPI002842C3C9|nr:ABC transporter ATP-binding protein [Dysosmobacter sp.]MDR3982635.1 ABC transporter ATP-binding protein [Dysosmobacter sp.]